MADRRRTINHTDIEDGTLTPLEFNTPVQPKDKQVMSFDIATNLFKWSTIKKGRIKK